MTKARCTFLAIKFPYYLIDVLDELVRRGFFISRSDAVRKLVLLGLQAMFGQGFLVEIINDLRGELEKLRRVARTKKPKPNVTHSLIQYFEYEYGEI
mgnify:CR=1 FL=1